MKIKCMTRKGNILREKKENVERMLPRVIADKVEPTDNTLMIRIKYLTHNNAYQVTH